MYKRKRSIYLISVILKYFTPERNAIAKYQMDVRFYKVKRRRRKNKNKIMKVLILKLPILRSEGASAKREQGKKANVTVNNRFRFSS